MHLTRSLGSLFSGQHPAHGGAHNRLEQDHSGHPQDRNNKPTTEDALNYLSQLAKEYHLPAKLVYSVADAESSLNPNEGEKLNYSKDKHGNYLKDKHGNRIVKSRDYGLMQINDKTWFGKEVKDPQGHHFKISEEVKHDWRANAKAGVAILSDAYRLAELEQGLGATAEDHAQQSYAQYNGGLPARDRYLKEKRDGSPAHDADREFLLKYRKRSNK